MYIYIQLRRYIYIQLGGVHTLIFKGGIIHIQIKRYMYN